MSVWIALLRGMNVGGKNKMKMTELKQTLEAGGLINVETYIQSGNIIFESAQREETLRTRIENELERALGISTAAILRTAGEMEQLTQNCPFSEAAIARAKLLNSEGESFYVGLLASAPLQKESEYLNQLKAEGEELQIRGREIYLLLQHSIRRSRLAGSMQKLDAPGTVRNWKTINKLHLLARARRAAGDHREQ